MPSVRVSKAANQEKYFLTCTITHWYYIFDRHNRWETLLDSLKYYQGNKNLKIYAWVFMLNHIHLIISSPDVSGFIRDFKKFTSKEFKKNIEATESNVLKIFEIKDGFHFWQSSNMPKVMESEKIFYQKKKYIEQNPGRKKYVKNPEDWIYSSANPNHLLTLADVSLWGS